MENMRSQLKPDLFIRKFLIQLLQLGLKVKEKQGSEAIESLASLHQYIPAYRWILANLPAGSKVLDWGCGNGHFSYFLREAGYEVTPYGFQPPQLLEVVYPGETGYVRGSEPVSLPFQDAIFDCVVSIGVLEHVREVGGDEVLSLGEIRRVLKEGGGFYCYHLPNKYSWIEFLARALGKWSHLYVYSKSDVKHIFETARMEVVEIRRYGILPRNTLRVLRPLGMARSLFLARCVDLTDALLLTFFGFFAQNWCVTARKTRLDGNEREVRKSI